MNDEAFLKNKAAVLDSMRVVTERQLEQDQKVARLEATVASLQQQVQQLHATVGFLRAKLTGTGPTG